MAVPNNGDVQSMKFFPDVEPTASTMVVEKAPGVTVDKYLEELGKKVDKLINSAVKHGKNGDPLKTQTGDLVIDGTNGAAIFEAVQRLSDIFDELVKRQAHIANLAKVWVEEGIFKEGFYHGDLHAGNIMINKDTATFIDFGNATKLTEEQQKHIMIMMLSAGSGQSDMFADSYRSLLTKEGKARFDAMKREIRPFLADILSRGTKEQAGKRIAAALKGLQDMGLELPAPIFNFSQSQQRLEATVDGINTLIGKIGRALTDFYNAGDSLSLDKYLLRLAYQGGGEPLKNAKAVIIDNVEKGSFRWGVEQIAFTTKYSYKVALYPILPPALKEKYTPEVMYPGITGKEELLEHRPSEEIQAEFWRDVERYIDQTREEYYQISRGIVVENADRPLSQEELESVFPMLVALEDKNTQPRLPSFFTLMSTVISAYLSNPLKKAAFAAKIGFINAWRLNN